MRSRRVVAALLCAAVVTFNQPAVVWAQEMPAGEASREMVAGRLVDLDGKTIWQGQLVRVVSAETGELVAQATTGEDASFQLPTLAPGEYVVSVGRVVARLVVTGERPVRELRVIVSAKSMEGEPIPLADLRQVESTGTTILIIGGVVVLVGLAGTAGAVIGYNARDGRRRTILGIPVSPSTP